MIEKLKYRTSEWWKPKAGLILSSIYLSVLINDVSLWDTFIYLPPALITILGIGILGHLINDFFDLSSDKQANKMNRLENKSFFEILAYLFFSFLLAFTPWLVLPVDNWVIIMLIVEVILLILYAIPYIRLKERGFLGLVTDSLYAYVVPPILAFYTFSMLGISSFEFTYFTLFAFLWLFFAGVYNLAIHQIEDFDNDSISQTKTWAVKIGKERAFVISKKLFWNLKVVFLFVFSISIFPYNRLAGVLLILAILFKLATVFNNVSLKKHYSNTNIQYLQYVNFHYHKWLTYLILGILVFYQYEFLILVAIHIMLFDFGKIRYVFDKIINHTLVRRILSLTRYVFIKIKSKIVGIDKEKSSIGELDIVNQVINFEKNRDLKVNVVLLNQNEFKYTETFVRMHQNFLQEQFFVHFICGQGIPLIHRELGSILGNDFVIQIRKILSSITSSDFKKYVKRKYTEFLIKNDVKVIVSEFGVTALEIVEICRTARVPLIVVFYGYDAHHIQFSPKTDNRYQGIFEYAAKIICVSKDIKNTLEDLGAPSYKLIYLPCAFDLSKFPYTDHSKNLPIFLSVGRFAETKSPHLTILAFKEVLKEIPNARLRMIGKDGGGELFEACHILVKALKIDDKVDFLGIQPPEAVYEEMKNARVFVQHSLTTPINEDKEGTPVSVMEAMACGLPVVATKHAGIAELITSEVNGILVDEYDYIAMAEAMVKVCESDELVLNYGYKAAMSIRDIEEIKNNKELFLTVIDQVIHFN